MSATPEPVPIVGSRGRDRTSGIILLALLLLAFLTVGSRVWRVASGPLPPGAGDDAPAFSLPTPDGLAAVSLAEHKGKVVLIDFWATWCPPCVASMPGIDRVYRELQGAGFVALGVNQEPGDELKVRAFLREYELSLPVGIDSGAIAKRYGVFSFPTSFLVDQTGHIISVHHGPVSEDTLRAEVKAALKGSSG